MRNLTVNPRQTQQQFSRGEGGPQMPQMQRGPSTQTQFHQANQLQSPHPSAYDKPSSASVQQSAYNQSRKNQNFAEAMPPQTHSMNYEYGEEDAHEEFVASPESMPPPVSQKKQQQQFEYQQQSNLPVDEQVLPA